MRAVLAIPGVEALRSFESGASILTQPIAGVPLLIRVIATAARSGVDSVVVIWPPDVDAAIFETCAESPTLRDVRFAKLDLTYEFDPGNASHWRSIETSLDDRFLWLPWNRVTNKRILAELQPLAARPLHWKLPQLLERRAVCRGSAVIISDGMETEGVSIDSPSSIPPAERFLVARSGKPTDGIYSNFNRHLCRPFVRLLARTRVTPNQITLAGLAVAILGAFCFARGFYAAYVVGALLFFVSGLFDEMDGMIARIKFLESAFGTWFEGFVDNATYLAVFAGMIIGLHRQFGSFAWQYGGALLLGSVLSFAVIACQRRLTTKRGRPHEYAARMNQLMDADSSNPISKIVRQVHIFVKKGVLIHYLLLFTLIGRLHMFLWLAALGSNLTWILALYFNLRFFRGPLPEKRVPTPA
jgi:phosphatidylglycerophosphate synthase